MWRKNFVKIIVFVSTAFFAGGALANPVLGNVAAGQVSIQQTPNTTVINQSSQQAIINWQSFNIGAQQLTHFQQPAGGIALNRINPTQGVSQIYGTLTATGRIILVNPAGVYFGPNAYVNVGGLIASTAGISDQDFLKGNYNFSQVSPYNASIINQGTIIAANHGLVALIGGAVENNGLIQANLGTAALGSGGSFSLSFAGNDLVSFRVNSNSLNGGVTNNGRIVANGGQILVTAKAASGVLDNVINMNGHVQANAVSQDAKGRIIFHGAGGHVRVNGTLEAKNGGFIETSGDHVILGSNLKVDTSSMGTWLIDPTDFILNNSNIPTIVAQLASSNVVIQTTGSSGSGVGDITVSDPLTWSSDNNLTLSAYRNIVNDSTITNANALGSLTLLANNEGAFDIASGNGGVINNGTINVAGTTDIYYNPTSTAYSPTAFATGGTTNAYMYVNNASELQAIQNTSSTWNKNFALSKNIDASTFSGSIGNGGTNFTGKMEGLGNIISNLSDPLFGVTSGTISNLGVSGSVVGSGLLAEENTGTISNIFANGLVMGGNDIGGLVGDNSGAISNVHAHVGVNGLLNVGGIAGINSGSISFALATGALDGITTGAIAGSNSGSISNSHSDITAMSQADYTGWDFASTWGIIEGQSYPYLKSIFPETPRVIAGQIGEFTAGHDNLAWPDHDYLSPIWESFSPLTVSQQEVTLAVSGEIIDKTYSQANGRYYFLEANGVIEDSSPLLTFLSNSANKSTGVTLAPTSGASATHVNLPLNTVLVSDNGQLNFASNDPGYTDDVNFTGIIQNMMFMDQSAIVSALGSLINSDILYSTSGNDVNVSSGNDFISAPTIFYGLTGNLTTDFGSISNYGYLAVGPVAPSYGDIVTMQTVNRGNIYTNNIVWPIDKNNPPTTTLYLNSANNIFMDRLVRGHHYDLTTFETLASGSLTLSAAYTNQSITTGPSSSIELTTFNLEQGKWYQNNNPSQIIEMPNTPHQIIWFYPHLFAYSIIFDTGVLPSPKVEFFSVGGGAGTIPDPYIIYHAAGLQGIATSTATLAGHYRLGGENVYQDLSSNFHALPHEFWYNGAGFIPIGTLSDPFSGTFDGNNMDVKALGIWNIGIYRPSEDNVGIFGVTSNTAVISNLLSLQSAIQGRNNVGGIVGINNGLIDNVTVNQAFITGENNVGAIAGVNNGIISNSIVTTNRTYGTSNVGGIAGENNGTIDKSLSANVVAGGNPSGGIAGTNTGTISNSFWDIGVTGQLQAAGVNSGSLFNVTGGCLYGCINTSYTGVDLSQKAIYEAAGWDFNSTWNIINGVSYPYSQIIYNPTGGAPQIFAGRTGVANQVLIHLWKTSLPGTFIVEFGTAVTGADGSFYSILPHGEIKPDDVVVYAFLGGNSSGSTAFFAKNDPNTGSLQNETNLRVPGTIIPGPSNSNVAYGNLAIYIIYSGLPNFFDDFLAFTYQSLLPRGNALYTTISDLYRYNYSLNSALYYQYGLYDDVKSYYDKYGYVNANLDTLLAFLKHSQRESFKNYELEPIRPAYCGK